LTIVDIIKYISVYQVFVSNIILCILGWYNTR